MIYRGATYWQTLLVWLLFLASVGALLVNSIVAFLLPGQELTARARIREATIKLVQAAEAQMDDISIVEAPVSRELNSRMESITRDALGNYQGIEGGFYINHHQDEFAGYAFPGEPERGPKPPNRREPPPREEKFIRLQARQSAVQDGSEILIETRDIGPSRVMSATAPVGETRPSRIVIWTMYRLTGPEQQRLQMYRYQASTVLALGGICTALILTWRLGRNLERERQAREQLRDELRRSEHLASLGLLLAQVAHEVRNPLAGIRSTVQLWQRLPDQSRKPESMAAVIAAVDRLDALLTDLLYFSRSESTQREPVDLNAVFHETLDLIRAQAADQHVDIHADFEPTVPTIQGSPHALRQVVLNLTTNALQSMPDGGQLSCRTHFNPSTKMVQLTIADTGRGIDPSIRNRLFEPFFTTRSEGTGLGLAMSREIVLQHHGRIELESVNPQGTLCRIELPVHIPVV